MQPYVFLVILLSSLSLQTVLAAPPVMPVTSEKKAHQILQKIYQQQPFTFFCHHPFQNTPIQWIPVIPYPQLAQSRLCYQALLCVDSHGKPYKGLRCCQKVDDTFKKMRLDLHNLIPENAMLKQPRHFRYGIIASGSKENHSCNYYFDKKQKILEPAPHLRGQIARTILYMHDTYHIALSADEIHLYFAWHKQYPVTPWERERNQRIREIQGNSNPYIN